MKAVNKDLISVITKRTLTVLKEELKDMANSHLLVIVLAVYGLIMAPLAASAGCVLMFISLTVYEEYNALQKEKEESDEGDEAGEIQEDSNDTDSTNEDKK